MPGELPAPPEPDMFNFNALCESSAALAEIAVAGSNFARIVYISGTESHPKGALPSHDAMSHQYVSCIVDGGRSA